MLEKEFQLLTDIEAGKALGGSSVSTCPIASVSPVISSNNFVGYDGSNCYDLAQEQMGLANTSAASWADSGSYRIFSQDIYGNSSTYANRAAEGVNYINCELQEGNLVMVGVNHGNFGMNEPNRAEGLAQDGTDHHIVLVGSGVDPQGRSYYNFYDSATDNVGQGISSTNRLYYNLNSGTLTGNSAAPLDDNSNDGASGYQVTTIRRTID